MSRRDMDRHIGAKIVAVWGREELDAWSEAGNLPEWWDFRTHALLCDTAYGFVVLSVPDVLGFHEAGGVEKVRVYGCDSPSSADSYWARLPVLVIEREWK